jgi:hypothetical protein
MTNNIRIIRSDKITIETTNLLIEQFINQTVTLKGRAITAYKYHIKTECEKITPSYVALIQYYISTKNNTNNKQIAKELTKNNKAFTTIFKKVIADKENKYIYEMIVLSWMEVIENLLNEAKSSLDVIASNIATHLMADMNYIVDEVFD